MRFCIGTMSRVLVLTGLAALVAACGGPSKAPLTQGANPGQSTTVSTIPEPPEPDTASLTPSNQTFTITKNVWDDYQLYLSRVGRIGNGYYAITEDGIGGASWSCSDALCGMSYNGKDIAMKQCQDSNPGKTCLIFAKDNHPQVRYEIAP
jgi:hypothetical protein